MIQCIEENNNNGYDLKLYDLKKFTYDFTFILFIIMETYISSCSLALCWCPLLSKQALPVRKE